MQSSLLSPKSTLTFKLFHFSCLTITVLWALLLVHHPCWICIDAKNASFVGANTVEILYTIPVTGSRRLFIASPTCVSFFFFSNTSLLMCYFYSVNLLPPSFGCQAMDQGAWLAKDVLLDTLTLIFSWLMNSVFLLMRSREKSWLFLLRLKKTHCKPIYGLKRLKNITVMNWSFTTRVEAYLCCSCVIYIYLWAIICWATSNMTWQKA